MEKRAVIAALCCIAAVLSFSTAGLLAVGQEAKAPDVDVSVQTQEGYIIKVYGDYLGVFPADGGSEPLFVTGIRVKDLRAYDAEQFSMGVIAADMQALLKFFEDFEDDSLHSSAK